MSAPPPPWEAPGPAARSRLDRFRRLARAVILASIFVNALMGIWAVAGSLGELESRILFTSLLVTACGAVSVACSTAIPEGRLGPVPVGGIAAAVAGFGLVIAALWQDFRPAPAWRAGVTLAIIAAGAAYASLLSGVQLSGRYRRLLPTAYLLAAGAGFFLISVAWGYGPRDAWRLFAVLAVLLGAVTVAAPVASRLHPSTDGPPPVRHCPYCGHTLGEPAGRTASCPSCRRRFRVLGR